MRDKRIPACVCIGLGTVLLLAALILQVHNLAENQAAARTSQELVAALKALAPLPELSGTAPAADPAPADPAPAVLRSEILEGHEYVGYLVFPSLNRTLPVMKIVYLEDLKIAPCLEAGSPLTDDAVISAHNYPAHFGPIRDWTGGEEVIFSTLDGQLIRYTVSAVETIDADAVKTVMESPYDLVLYTCTTGGEKRVMIACDKT